MQQEKGRCKKAIATAMTTIPNRLSNKAEAESLVVIEGLAFILRCNNEEILLLEGEVIFRIFYQLSPIIHGK
jgi:hypothetical protein